MLEIEDFGGGIVGFRLPDEGADGPATDEAKTPAKAGKARREGGCRPNPHGIGFLNSGGFVVFVVEEPPFLAGGSRTPAAIRAPGLADVRRLALAPDAVQKSSGAPGDAPGGGSGIVQALEVEALKTGEAQALRGDLRDHRRRGAPEGEASRRRPRPAG